MIGFFVALGFGLMGVGAGTFVYAAILEWRDRR